MYCLLKHLFFDTIVWKSLGGGGGGGVQVGRVILDAHYFSISVNLMERFVSASVAGQGPPAGS